MGKATVHILTKNDISIENININQKQVKDIDSANNSKDFIINKDKQLSLFY